MNDSQIGELLDLIYGAAVAPAMWIPAMERLADALGGNAAFLSRLNLADGSGSIVTARVDPAMVDLYFAHYASTNPLNNVDDPGGFIRRWTPRVLTDEEWVDKESLVRTEYYNDFMRPQDVNTVMMIRLEARDSNNSVMNVNRGAARGPFQRRERELAAQVRPHLARALRLGQALATDRLVDKAAADVFGGSAHAIFLLDENRRVRRANDAAEVLITAEKGIVSRGGRLSASDPDADRQLVALISRAASRQRAERRPGSMILAASEHTPLSITVAPVRAESLPVLDDRPLVLVCVCDPSDGAPLPEERLRALFSLTRSEARVALALFDGASPREAAMKLGISPNTVQVHLSRIFDKTGAHRQSALIKLLTQVAGRRSI